ncbi:MAG: RNA polymerase sigma factor [Clostridia bacterium]|nr:RNA polymerase sigma factor [Clostridia bacterium]
MPYTKEALYKLLCEQYLPAFPGFARSRVSDADTAEELCQEIAFRCVNAIEGARIRDNPDAYFWSIAHNTCKAYYARRQPISIEAHDLGNVLPSDARSPEEMAEENEEYEEIRRALSRLSGLYRRVLIAHYYDGMSVCDIAAAFDLSESMVKFYLRSGREKLKEVYLMQNTTVSVKPIEFSIYKSGIDFARINVSTVFSRKLPAQLAILCHDKPMTISALSVETGVPAVYLEEEIALLLGAGVMISPVKDKYRTNFHILKKNAFEQIKAMFSSMYRDYIAEYRAVYEAYLPQLKASGIFRHEASEQEYRWFFFLHTPALDWRNLFMSEADYPQILSCGSRALVFAAEAPDLRFSAGHTPTELPATDAYPAATVWPCDVMAFGEYHRQSELDPFAHAEKCRVLCDIAMGIPPADDENTRLLCAELAQEGYIERDGDRFVSRMPVTDAKARTLFAEIEGKLQSSLEKPTARLYERICDTVKATLVPQLADYAHGFSVTWIGFLEGALFAEALYEDGFLEIPAEDDNRPYACRIILND